MRKKLLYALAACFGISLLLFLTRTTSVSFFFQGLAQSIFQAPKAAIYGYVAHADSTPENDLAVENRRLIEKMAEYNSLKKDNEAFRNQFQETAIDAPNLLPATVVGFQGSFTNPEVLVIDRGNAHSVREGSAVVVGKHLVGVVESVSSKYSSVRLVTNGSFSTVAKVSENGALGVVTGAGDSILFDRIATNDTVRNGDIVLTRGTVDVKNGGILPNLIIGKVESVRKVASEPFQSAQVKSLVDIAHITKVFVVVHSQ